MMRDGTGVCLYDITIYPASLLTSLFVIMGDFSFEAIYI